MTTLHIIKPKPAGAVVHQREIVGCLHPDILDRIRGQVLVCREQFCCPYTVKDHEEFGHVLLQYHGHYQKSFYGIELEKLENIHLARSSAFEFLERCFGNYQGGLHAAERNAVAGREGGMIRIVDVITEGIAKHHTNLYVQSVFRELVPPNDWDLRFRVAQELLDHYGPFLLPGERLLPAALFGVKFEEFLMSFVNHVHELRKQWRY